jgi:hypothetical protein
MDEAARLFEKKRRNGEASKCFPSLVRKPEPVGVKIFRPLVDFESGGGRHEATF